MIIKTYKENYDTVEKGNNYSHGQQEVIKAVAEVEK